MNPLRLTLAVFRGSLLLLLMSVLVGCVVPGGESIDSSANYAAVFKTMRQPQPTIVNSRLDFYRKDLGPWRGAERNGEWEFELIAPKAWVDEVKYGFVRTTFDNWDRLPGVAWWRPSAEHFEAYRMPYSSYSAAHLYVEKDPQDADHIHVFIRRH